MGTTNFGKCDFEKLEKKYDEALKNESFQKLVNRLKLPKETLMKYTSSLEESAQELSNCANCKHLATCKNKIEGFVYFPSKFNNHLKFDYIACKHEQKHLKDEALSCNYFKMNEANKRASMKDIELDDAKRVKAIKWLKNFYDTYKDNPKQKGLYLHGSFGSGKTYLTCAMLNELAKSGVDITIVYYPELLRSLKESFETDFSSKIDKIKKTEILFLDDIGAESVTAWSRDEILGTILQYRMDSYLPTFFTSNLTIEELETHLSMTKSGTDLVKARRIIERIKQLTENIELISKNRRV